MLEEVPRLTKSSYDFIPPRFDASSDLGEEADVDPMQKAQEKYALPLHQMDFLKFTAEPDLRFNAFSAMDTKARNELLTKRAAAPSLGEIQASISNRERLMLDRFAAPELLQERKLVTEFCNKIFSSTPGHNPSLDTYLGKDNNITWEDIYGSNEEMENTRMTFEQNID